MVDRERQADRAAGADTGAGHQKLAAGAPERAGVSATAATGQSAAQPAAVKTLSDSPDLIEFDLAVAVLYNRSREAWFSRLHKAVMFFTIAFGAGTVANLAPTLTGVATAMLGALDLAFDLTGQATKHAEIKQAHLAIVRKLADAGFSPEACAKARSKMLRIGEREPPPYAIVELLARNAAILSLGRDRSQLESVGHLQRLTRHIWRWDGA